MASVVIPTEKQGIVFPQAQCIDLHPNFSWVSSLRKSVGKYWEDDGRVLEDSWVSRQSLAEPVHFARDGGGTIGRV